MENLDKVKKQYFASVINKIDDQTLKDILNVEEKSFPEQMQSDEDDLKESLKNKRGIQIIAKDEKGEIVSYLSSLPLKDTFKNLKNYDTELKSEKDVLYIESVATIPENRDIKIFLKGFELIKQEAQKRGFKKISAHVRVSNGLSGVLQKMGAKKLRTIENWYDFNEPFDYLEFEVENLNNKK